SRQCAAGRLRITGAGDRVEEQGPAGLAAAGPGRLPPAARPGPGEGSDEPTDRRWRPRRGGGPAPQVATAGRRTGDLNHGRLFGGGAFGFVRFTPRRRGPGCPTP